MLSLSDNRFLYSLFAVVGLADIGVWSVIMNPPKPGIAVPIISLSIRVSLSFLLFAFIKSKTRCENPGILGSFTAISFFLFSIIGIAGTFFIINEARKGSHKHALYHIDKEEGEEIDAPLDYHNQSLINLNEMREVAPLAEGMTDDKTMVRIATIRAMEDASVTNIRNVIVDSINDKSKDVQYFAHEALKKISNSYIKKIKQLTNIINNSEPTYDNYKELADLYAEFAHKNVEHPVLVEFYRKEAIKHYNNLLNDYPDNRIIILTNLIAVLFENGDYETCIKYCKEAYNYPEFVSMSIEFKARCLFQLRDIKSLKKLATKEEVQNVSVLRDFMDMCKEELYYG